MGQQPYECHVDQAIESLTRARDLILSEIAAYPTPISGCDQQYIRLISDRTRISQSIQSLKRRPFVATPRTLEETAA